MSSIPAWSTSDPPGSPTGSGRSRGAALPAPGRDNDEFASLREYQAGDDIRRMHWPSTARTDTLMVRQDQVERRGQFCVVLDTRRQVWSAPSFERAASAAASIAAAALDAGLHTRLLTTAGRDSGSDSGRHHRLQILDLLAAAGVGDEPPPRGGVAQAGVFAAPLLAEGGTVAVVTSDRADIAELHRLARKGTRTEVLMVVVERSTPDEGPETARRVAPGPARLIRVTATAGLARSWDRIA